MLGFQGRLLSENEKQVLKNIQNLLISQKYDEGLAIITSNILNNPYSSFNCDYFLMRLEFYKALFQNKLKQHASCLETIDSLKKATNIKTYISPKEWNFLFYIEGYSFAELGQPEKAIVRLLEMVNDNSDIYIRSRLLMAALLLKGQAFNDVIGLLLNLEIANRNVEFLEEYHLLLGFAFAKTNKASLSLEHLQYAFQLITTANIIQSNFELKINGLKLLAESKIDNSDYDDALEVLNVCESLRVHLLDEQQIGAHLFDILYLMAKCHDAKGQIQQINEIIKIFATNRRVFTCPTVDIMYAQLLLFGIYHGLKEIKPTSEVNDMLNDDCFNKSEIPQNIMIEKEMAKTVYHFKHGNPWGYSESLAKLNSLFAQTDNVMELILPRIVKKWTDLIEQPTESQHDPLQFEYKPFVINYSKIPVSSERLDNSPSGDSKMNVTHRQLRMDTL